MTGSDTNIISNRKALTNGFCFNCTSFVKTSPLFHFYFVVLLVDFVIISWNVLSLIDVASFVLHCASYGIKGADFVKVFLKHNRPRR